MASSDEDPVYNRPLRQLPSKSKDEEKDLMTMLDDALKQQRYSSERTLTNYFKKKESSSKRDSRKKASSSGVRKKRHLKADKRSIKKLNLLEEEIAESSGAKRKSSSDVLKSSHSKQAFFADWKSSTIFKQFMPSTMTEIKEEPLNQDEAEEHRNILEDDLKCLICRGMAISAHNQMAKCVECHCVYHQECHQPRIADTEIDDPTSAWYCATCTKGINKMGASSTSMVKPMTGMSLTGITSAPQSASSKPTFTTSATKTSSPRSTSSGKTSGAGSFRNMASSDEDPVFNRASRQMPSKSKDEEKDLMKMLDDALKQQRYARERTLTKCFKKKESSSKRDSRKKASSSGVHRKRHLNAHKSSIKKLNLPEEDIAESSGAKRKSSSDALKSSDSKQVLVGDWKLSTLFKQFMPSTMTESEEEPLNQDEAEEGCNIFEEDLKCLICSEMDRGAHNQMVKCVKCHCMYHQECHHPPIADTEINDPTSAWCCATCTKGINEMGASSTSMVNPMTGMCLTGNTSAPQSASSKPTFTTSTTKISSPSSTSSCKTSGAGSSGNMASSDEDPVFNRASRQLPSKSKDEEKDLMKMLDDALKQQRYASERTLTKCFKKKESSSKRDSRKKASSSGVHKKRHLKAHKRSIKKLNLPEEDIAESSGAKRKSSSDVLKSSHSKQVLVGDWKLSTIFKQFMPSTMTESKAEPLNQDEDEEDCIILEDDLKCLICRGMAIGARNQMVMCVECHCLYHQECHQPPIADTEINDPTTPWCCATCIKGINKMDASSTSMVNPMTGLCLTGITSAPQSASSKPIFTTSTTKMSSSRSTSSGKTSGAGSFGNMASSDEDPGFNRASRQMPSKSKDEEKDLMKMLDDALKQQRYASERTLTNYFKKKESSSKRDSRKKACSSGVHKKRHLKAHKRSIKKLNLPEEDIAESSGEKRKSKSDVLKSSHSKQVLVGDWKLSTIFNQFMPSTMTESKEEPLNQDEDEDDCIILEDDLKCLICSGMDIGAHNQMVMCVECHCFYHQECHQPPIADTEINDPTTPWCCATCIKGINKMGASSTSMVKHMSGMSFTGITWAPQSSSSKPTFTTSSPKSTSSGKTSGGLSQAPAKPVSSSSSSSSSSRSVVSVAGISKLVMPNINIISAEKNLQIIEKKAAKLQEKRKHSK